MKGESLKIFRVSYPIHRRRAQKFLKSQSLYKGEECKNISSTLYTEEELKNFPSFITYTSELI